MALTIKNAEVERLAEEVARLSLRVSRTARTVQRRCFLVLSTPHITRAGRFLRKWSLDELGPHIG